MLLQLAENDVHPTNAGDHRSAVPSGLRVQGVVCLPEHVDTRQDLHAGELAPAGGAPLTEIDGLSEDEIVELLARKLGDG